MLAFREPTHSGRTMMKGKIKATGFPGRGLLKFLGLFGVFLAVLALPGVNEILAATQVTASGQGGKAGQSLPDSGGPFDLQVPLTKNALNTIIVTAVDAYGNSVSQEIPVTQVSLDSIVVSKVTTERLSVQQVEQLVAEGTIKLDNPENYNVSKFDIVLTIAKEPVAISVAIPVPKEEKTGWETYKLPKDELGWGKNKLPEEKPQIIVFEQKVTLPEVEQPMSIPGVIIIEGRIKSLKEFYSVRLLLMNTSGIFTLKDVSANIEFPDGGLTKVLPADGIVSFGNILPGDGGQPGQVEKEFIIRGDTIGIRRVKANFGGLVAGPGIPEDKAIPFNGSAFTDVEVKGPPTFKVQVFHPDSVAQNVPYELKVDITNTGDIAAMYASLELDVGADAQLVKCENLNGNPVCRPIEGSDIRNFGHILSGQTVREVFTINPLKSGYISSCVGVADQNITLQVLVGTIGCVVGHFPPERGVPEGVPTVSVAPAANAFGLSIDSPVTAFFSEKMREASITTGSGGSFNIYDRGSRLIPGQIRQITLNDKTVAIWQVNDGITNRLAPNTEYTVILTKDITDLEGNGLFNEWTSRFTTTGMGMNDTTPPTLTLSIEPPVDPNYVLPGQIVKVDAYGTDQGSGIARVELRLKNLNEPSASYTLVDQKTVFNGKLPPYIFSIDSAKLVPGHAYMLLGTAYDGMGNTQNATISLVLAASADPPVITLPDDPALPVLQGISVSLTPVQLTGGVREVRYYLDGSPSPFKTVNLAPFQAGLSTLNLALGSHTIRAVAEDGLGQTGEDSYVFTLAQNLNMPVVALVGSESGAQVVTGSSFTLRGEATDPVGIQSVNFYVDSIGGTPIASGTQAFTVNTAGMSLGQHTIYVKATNTLGVSNNTSAASSYLQFTVVAVPNGPPPAAPSVTSIAPPVNGRAAVGGNSLPGARIDITNTALNIALSVTANTSGAFSASVPADAGQVLSLVAYVFSQSQQPSSPATVTVPAPPTLIGISLAPGAVTFTSLNATRDLTVTGSYNDGTTANLTSQATFTSGNGAVASVNTQGRVAALGNGSTVITAGVGGFQATTQVTVEALILTAVTVSPSPIAFITTGQTQGLTVTGQYSNGTTQTLSSGNTFSTGNPAVATVNLSGVVTAVGRGSTQITVSRSGVSPVAVSVTVDLAQDTAPTVSITSPASGAAVERGQSVSVAVQAQDVGGGVTRLYFEASGAMTFSDLKQFAPVLNTAQTFLMTVANEAPVGGTITARVRAEDTLGQFSAWTSITLTVVDRTAPTVSITAPANQTPFNFGDTVSLAVAASDAVGVTRIRYEATGAFTASGARDFSPPPQAANANFNFSIPYGLQNPEVQIVAYARDGAGNERASTPVTITITDADITPPQTRVTQVAPPGSSATTTIGYEVTAGLADLDHVLLYFRRNGIGTYNRYTQTDAGNPEGKYFPQAGNTGTIVFDSTKMGGDGTYEFYSVGVDKAGNREKAPFNQKSPKEYSGLRAYYPFNGTVVDDTGNGNNGTLTGAVYAADRFEQGNSALDFDGTSQYVNLGNPVPAGLQIQNEITLAAWIYVTQYPGSGTLGTIVGCQYDAAVSGYAIHLDGRTNPDGQTAPPGHVHFQIGNGSWHGANANGAVPLNQWVHVAATRRANESARIYYNGVLQPSTSAAWNGSITYTGAELDIGRQMGFTNRFFNGVIDDVQIFERALTAQEIAELAVRIPPDQTATFNAGTVWTTITSPTVIGSGDAAFDDKNLRIVGTTVTVDGYHSFHNVDLLNGAVLTHPKTDTVREYGLDFGAWTLTIDSSSSINLDGRGYPGGKGFDESGRTVGNLPGSATGAGGSHGGLGGSYGGGVPNPVYGDLTNPTDLGSGGGAWDDFDGGDGGGRTRLNTLNVTLDGVIRANGGESAASAAGDGSGGAIFIVSKTLSGNGTIQANGGGNNSGTGAGGGRVAVIHLDMETMNTTGITAQGGLGYYGNGANGTVFLKQEQNPGGELVITGQGPSSPWTDLHIPPGYTFDSLTLRNNARVIVYDPISVTGKVWISGNSVLTHNNGNENGLVIRGAEVQVDAGSFIDVTGRGYLGGRGFDESGRTVGNVYGSLTGAGGSYGGSGAGYENRISNRTYGSLQTSDKLGSGGGAWDNSAGGDGGGRISITASEAVTVNGAIRANGGESAGSAAGAGSGGSILIRTSRLAGDGFISANGGGTGNGAGGGGGRVAVHCDYVEAGHDFNNLYNLTAWGGRGYYDTRRSSAGTVFIQLSSQELGDLYVDDHVVDGSGNPNGASPESTPLTLIGFGTTSALNGDTLTTDGSVVLLPNDLAGLRFNPDINQPETFVIQTNTADTITVTSPNENGVSFFTVAGVGRTYAGVYRFDNVLFRRGGNLVAGDLVEVAGTMRIGEYGLLRHYEATSTFVSHLDLTAENLVIEDTGRIDVTGHGYIGGKEYNETGRTVGNVLGATQGAGGSYGGLGGGYQNAVPNQVYGDLTDPRDLGSGGGAWNNEDGGDGGGLLLIRAGTVTLNGTIRSNGGESQGSAAGDGSGGGINLTAGSLTGAGFIQANGGGGGSGVGGGGGRIAISIRDTLSFTEGNIQAVGGVGYYGNAGQGTVYLRKPGQLYGEIVVDGLGHSTPADTTVLTGNLMLDNLTIQNGARVLARGSLAVTGSALIAGASVLAADGGLTSDTVRVTGSSEVTHSRGHEPGLVIQARVFRVDAGSAINVTGRGHLGGRDYNERGRTLGNIYGSDPGAGGSYGGIGAGYQGRSSYRSYGGLRNPDKLGSGGGAWNNEDGGDGGGRVTITASEAVIVDGAIRADGGESAGTAAGDGSGGSVFIRTSMLSGDGFISANGGGNGNGTGGGGGRVAVYCDTVETNHKFNNLYNLTAWGGRGYYDDRQSSAGTVYFHYNHREFGNLIVDDNRVDGSGNPNSTAPEPTLLTLIGFGTTALVNGNTLTTDGLVALLPGDLAGMRINPDVGQTESFVIQSNTADSLTVVSPNENGALFSTVAETGKTYAGSYHFDNVTFRRGGHLMSGDLLEVVDTMWIGEYGLLRHYEATTEFVTRLDLTAGTLTIEPTGRIDVTGQGYPGGREYNERGRTVGNAPGSAPGAGGSYGGLGGSYGGAIPNPVYGLAADPRELGSGGGAWNNEDGGDGGGLLLIRAGTVTLNGTIRSNGGESQGSPAGDGSGGGIKIVSGTLSGSGVIQADGGGGGSGVGGGGGRIALYYQSFGMNSANVTALGGKGYYGTRGQDGTVYPWPLSDASPGGEGQFDQYRVFLPLISK